MNNSKDVGINISGLIQNMLDSGFDDKDSLAEFIDNSFGALASKVNIHIDTETNQIIITDNGSGMTKDVLASACVLHNRTKASDDKQGCFGIGGKHAMVHFTQHDGKTHD
jgi:DNA topoisomerase VI subunit B